MYDYTCRCRICNVSQIVFKLVCPLVIRQKYTLVYQDRPSIDMFFKLIDAIRPPSHTHQNTHRSKFNLPLGLSNIVHIHLTFLLILSYLLFTIEHIVFNTLLHSIIMFQNEYISCFNHKFSHNNKISTIIPQFCFKYQQHTSVYLHI